MAESTDYGGEYFDPYAGQYELQSVQMPVAPEYSIPYRSEVLDPYSAQATHALGEISYWPYAPTAGGGSRGGGDFYTAPPAPVPTPAPGGGQPPFPGQGWGTGGTPPQGGNPPGTPGTFPGPGEFPSQGGGQPPQTTGSLPGPRPGRKNIAYIPPSENYGQYGGPPEHQDWWNSIGDFFSNAIRGAWNATPFSGYRAPPIPNTYGGVDQGFGPGMGGAYENYPTPATGTRTGYSDAEQARRDQLAARAGFNAPPAVTGGERVNAQDPRVQAAAATVNEKKTAAESALGRPLTPDEERILWERTIGPNIGQPQPTGQGGGGRSVGELAFLLNSHQISEPDAYREAWAGGFRGSYRDFLVEKDRIIHQSGVNRGGGAFQAPVAQSVPRTLYGQPQYAAPAYRGPLMTRRIAI